MKIREQIYGHYLFGSKSWNPKVQTFALQKMCHYLCRVKIIKTDIFLLNKLISRESTHFFYSHCTFYAADVPDCRSFDEHIDRDRYEENWVPSLHCSLDQLYQFLEVIGKSNRRSIRCLEIGIWWEETVDLWAPKRLVLAKTFNLLSKNHNLRNLTLTFDTSPCLREFIRDSNDNGKGMFAALSNIRGLDRLTVRFRNYYGEFPEKAFVEELGTCYDESKLPERIEKISKMVENAQSKSTIRGSGATESLSEETDSESEASGSMSDATDSEHEST